MFICADTSEPIEECSCGLNHIRDAKLRAQRDPTRTLDLRRAFIRSLEKRWKRIGRLVTDAVATQDMFGLAIANSRALQIVAMSSGRVNAFQQWIDAALADTILGMDRELWIGGFIREAYSRGWNATKVRVKRDLPLHIDRADIITKLTISELQGVIEAFSQRAVRAFSDGLLSHLPPATIARTIRKDVAKIGIVRARLTVQTLVVRANGEAALDYLQSAGHTYVDVLPETIPSPGRSHAILDAKKKARRARRRGKFASVVEVLTAGDDDVCPVCEDIALGNPYKIAEARGLIPAHPRCRCAFVPAYDARFAHGDSVSDDWNEEDHPRGERGEFTETFHGTTKENLKSILKNGLQVSGGSHSGGHSSGGGGFWRSGSTKAVFLARTKKLAASYARSAAGKSGVPVVLTVRVPKSQFASFKEDMEHPAGEAVYRSRKIPASWIVASKTYDSADADYEIVYVGLVLAKPTSDEWNEEDHPRNPAGGPDGGQFENAGGGSSKQTNKLIHPKTPGPEFAKEPAKGTTDERTRIRHRLQVTKDPAERKLLREKMKQSYLISHTNAVKVGNGAKAEQYKAALSKMGVNVPSFAEAHQNLYPGNLPKPAAYTPKAPPPPSPPPSSAPTSPTPVTNPTQTLPPEDAQDKYSPRQLIRMYTGSHYTAINSGLREGVLSENQYKFVAGVNKGLDELPVHTGQVYRKVHDATGKFFNYYKPGMIIEERGFMSTSKNIDKWSGNLKLSIKSKTGRDIQHISAHPNEQEVLFKSGTRFRVKSVDPAKTIVHLEEV